jgi:NAD(P)-dependent dehydrogenase (short-subunit alcohol dehydrogenase family)
MESAPSALPGQALLGKVVLVTGCTGAFGSALARAAAAAGATLVLLGRRVAALERLYDELRAAGAAEPALYPLDLQGASAEEFAGLAAAIGQGCGALHGIVHAAARFDGLASLEFTEPLSWLAALHVNLSAPIQLTRACLPLLEQSGGSVVFVSDDPERVTRANWGAYGVAKYALAGAVRQLDLECEHRGVRIHGFVPEPMRGGIRARAYMAEDPGMLPGPEALAPSCLWLLTEAAAGLRGTMAGAGSSGWINR